MDIFDIKISLIWKLSSHFLHDEVIVWFVGARTGRYSVILNLWFCCLLGTSFWSPALVVIDTGPAWVGGFKVNPSTVSQHKAHPDWPSFPTFSHAHTCTSFATPTHQRPHQWGSFPNLTCSTGGQQLQACRSHQALSAPSPSRRSGGHNSTGWPGLRRAALGLSAMAWS